MKNLRVLREEKGVTQQKVADAIGSNQQSIHKYEIGEYEPDIQTMKLLAEYFDTSIDYLVGGTEIRNRIVPVEKYELNQQEQNLIDKFRELSPEHRKCLSTMLDALIEAEGR